MPSLKLILLAAASLVIVLLLISCDSQKPAVGLEDEIFVIADTSEYYELEPALAEVFEKVIYTPQPEKLFELKRKPFEQLNGVKNKKNVIIIAPLNSGSLTSDYISGLLDSNVNKLVSDGSEYAFIKNELWARDQLVMILTAPTIDDLKQNILINKENLIHYFKTISNKRLYKSLYNAKYERKDVEAQLLKDHGWIIYVQADFQLAKNAHEDNFVWLRRSPNSEMERWIFVHWIENASPELLMPDSIFAIRNRLTKKHYLTSDNQEFVEISNDQLPAVTEVNFLDRYALLTQGFWRFSMKSGGGPFLSYTFFDEQTKRIYMLDGSVYAPKYYKKKILQQLDVILQSWMPAYELPESKIKSLMSELE